MSYFLLVLGCKAACCVIALTLFFHYMFQPNLSLVLLLLFLSGDRCHKHQQDQEAQRCRYLFINQAKTSTILFSSLLSVHYAFPLLWSRFSACLATFYYPKPDHGSDIVRSRALKHLDD
ncbi:hypothetical protein P280DRAFT_180213 [Massarina eburnea CBS 473.64]|uniref:Uncharacterized protein n=1 Tax=Massarina eburnea CBS 473.64 TaxID=1395130 RepID=A0A6A6SD59_9PLEO|nr:hypothetical protein P280DRAFT_180213 [Massarina eburnea CBS 473.64]